MMSQSKITPTFSFLVEKFMPIPNTYSCIGLFLVFEKSVAYFVLQFYVS